MQTNQYQEIEKHYQKGIFCVFLSLLPTKNAKMEAKHSILGNKRTCFIVSEEPQRKKQKKCVDGEVS